MRKLKYSLIGLGLLLIGVVFSSQLSGVLGGLFQSGAIDLAVNTIPRIDNPHQNRVSKLEGEAILFWAQRAVKDIYTLSYKDYIKQLQHASSYFNTQGWHAYREALYQSKKVDFILEHKGLARVEWLEDKPGRLRLDKTTQQFFAEIPVRVIWQLEERMIQDERLLSLQLEFRKGQAPQIFIQQLSERDLI